MRALIVSLVLSCFWVFSLSAQQNISAYSFKLSPSAIEASKKNLNQSQIFWILSNDTLGLKRHFDDNSSRISLLNSYPSVDLLVVRSSWSFIDSLLPSQMIRFVDMPRKPIEELAVGSIDNSVNQINLAHLIFPPVTGQGMVVSIKENRFDSTDIDFKGRYLPTSIASPQLTTHALIMASLIGGGGNTFYTGKGVARSSTLSSSNFANLLPETDAVYRQYNISVQNHSYGTGIENFYGVDAAAYDASVIANQSLVHVFSAGNSGNLASNSGTYNGITGFANLTGSFKMAKNVLTVGATDSFNNVALLSSRGPAYDGRIKPELVAFGEDGSSGAAALVSGTALLIQEAYKKTNNRLPSSALVRALLVNSAIDPGNEGPDYAYGFGILNANLAVGKLIWDPLMDLEYFEDSIDAAGTKDYPLNLPPGPYKLKITLCWNDPPSTPNAPAAIVNDLDIELINTTTGEVWLPWILSRHPHPDSLMAPARRGKDNLNTVELISLVNPPPGNYKIRVRASSITGSRQAYFIVPSIEQVNSFAWTYPTWIDKPFAKSSAVLRWNSTFGTLNGSLEYQLGNNGNWKLIDASVDLSKNYYRWAVPDSFAFARLRMTINGTTFVGDQFVVSNPLTAKVGFNCPDSFLLYWNKPIGIDSFALYKLGDLYLEEFKRVRDSFVVIGKSNNLILHYTVAPIISGQFTGIKTETFNYTTQGVECYIKNFLVNLDQSSANLLIELGTLYQVSSITAEKLIGSEFRQLQSVNISGLQYSLNDNTLHKGGNTYRIKLVLANGKVIYSNPETIYYFDDSKYLIFPNPADRSQRLIIHSKDLDPSRLVLFNSQGQKVLEKELRNPVEEIPLHSYQKGIYFYIIYKSNKKDHQGSIVIR